MDYINRYNSHKKISDQTKGNDCPQIHTQYFQSQQALDGKRMQINSKCSWYEFWSPLGINVTASIKNNSIKKDDEVDPYSSINKLNIQSLINMGLNKQWLYNLCTYNYLNHEKINSIINLLHKSCRANQIPHTALEFLNPDESSHKSLVLSNICEKYKIKSSNEFIAWLLEELNKSQQQKQIQSVNQHLINERSSDNIVKIHDKLIGKNVANQDEWYQFWQKFNISESELRANSARGSKKFCKYIDKTKQNIQDLINMGLDQQWLFSLCHRDTFKRSEIASLINLLTTTCSDDNIFMKNIKLLKAAKSPHITLALPNICRQYRAKSPNEFISWLSQEFNNLQKNNKEDCKQFWIEIGIIDDIDNNKMINQALIHFDHYKNDITIKATIKELKDNGLNPNWIFRLFRIESDVVFESIKCILNILLKAALIKKINLNTIKDRLKIGDSGLSVKVIYNIYMESIKPIDSGNDTIDEEDELLNGNDNSLSLQEEKFISNVIKLLKADSESLKLKTDFSIFWDQFGIEGEVNPIYDRMYYKNNFKHRGELFRDVNFQDIVRQLFKKGLDIHWMLTLYVSEAIPNNKMIEFLTCLDQLDSAYLQAIAVLFHQTGVSIPKVAQQYKDNESGFIDWLKPHLINKQTTSAMIIEKQFLNEQVIINKQLAQQEKNTQCILFWTNLGIDYKRFNNDRTLCDAVVKFTNYNQSTKADIIQLNSKGLDINWIFSISLYFNAKKNNESFPSFLSLLLQLNSNQLKLLKILKHNNDTNSISIPTILDKYATEDNFIDWLKNALTKVTNYDVNTIKAACIEFWVSLGIDENTFNKKTNKNEAIRTYKTFSDNIKEAITNLQKNVLNSQWVFRLCVFGKMEITDLEKLLIMLNGYCVSISNQLILTKISKISIPSMMQIYNKNANQSNNFIEALSQTLKDI